MTESNEGGVRVERQVRQAQRIKNVLVDVSLSAEPPDYVGRWARTPQRRAEELREWVSEFEAFLRDHRSRDHVRLEVVEIRKDLCSACNGEWETYEEDGKVFCACCGAEVA